MSKTKTPVESTEPETVTPVVQPPTPQTETPTPAPEEVDTNRRRLRHLGY